jgi:type IX secretion system PorP/SprF family membrane protein
MKKLLTLIPVVIFLWSVEGNAQQLPHFSQYMINDYVLNPAIGGKQDYFMGMSANRYQWKGITDAPRTYMLSVNGPLKYDHMGVGGQLFTDNVGPTRRTGFYLSYAYHAPLTEKLKLSMGLSAGILQFMIDGHKINLHDPGDLVITNSVQSVLTPDFSAGFYLYNDKFWVGFSALQIQQSKLKFFDYMSNTTSVLNRHYYGMAGYRFNLGDDFILEPSILTKYVTPVPFQFDAGARIIYKDKIWLGGAYRHLDAITAYTGFVIRENLQIGYAFDFTSTNLRNYSSGTHELILAIRFNKNGLTSGSSAPQFN